MRRTRVARTHGAWRRRGLRASASLGAVLLLGGCAHAVVPAARPLGGEAVQLVVGTHANEPAPTLPSIAIQRVTDAVAGEKAIGVVTVEGTPRILQPPLPMSVTGSSAADRTATDRAAVDSIERLVQQARPSTDGADLLAALVLAAKRAHDATTPVSHLLVLDNGLSDRGALDFTVTGMSGADPAEVVASLIRQRALHRDSFDGLTVEFVGLGRAVAPPQAALSAAQVRTVVAVYSAVVRAGGGTPVISSATWTGRAVDTGRPVRTVRTGDDTVRFGVTTALGDGSSIAFLPGTARFRDPAAAKRLLQPVAAWLAPGTRHRAVVVGTTSSEGSASKQSDLRLSQGRADAVKTLLVSLGAASDRIVAQGKGYIAEPPDRVDGVLDPAKAAQNRVVRLTTIQ